MRKPFIPLLMTLTLFAALISFLDTFPPIVWDEGWTAIAARNWVERGFYGMYLNGEPSPAGQSAAFPSVLSIATAFQWFGIGFWQGRFVSVAYMMGAFAALYALGRSLYGRRIALLSILALVPFASMVHMQALYIGRNMLAEPFMLFFLLMGFVFFLRALRKREPVGLVLALIGAVIMWSLALDSKAQPLPFWIVSLSVGFFYCVYQRHWREARLTAVSFLLSLALMRGWLIGVEIFLGDKTLPALPTPGLLNLTAMVLVPEVRINALLTFLLTGLLLFFGLIVASQKWLRPDRLQPFPKQLTRLMLLAFVGSWLLWYLSLSIGWERYLFPASFVGSIFVGLLLGECILRNIQPQGMPSVQRGRRFAALTIVSLVCLLYIVLTVWQIVPQLQSTSYARDTTAWLNANIPPSSLVETYEIELLFGLDARAHYPPDIVNVEMNRKREIDPSIVLSYDPRSVNADYVIVGYVGRKFHLYDELLHDGSYTPLAEVGSYSIYQNNRSVKTTGVAMSP